MGTKTNLAAAAILGGVAFAAGWWLRPLLSPEERTTPLGSSKPSVSTADVGETPALAGPVLEKRAAPSTAPKRPEPQPAADAPTYLRRINEAKDVAAATAIVREMAALPPEQGRDILLAIFRDIRAPGFRALCLAGFADHPFTLPIHHLATTDPDLAVQAAAYRFLSQLAFQDFAEDHQAYLKWWERNRDRSIESVLRENALPYLTKLRDLHGDALGVEVRRLRSSSYRLPRVAGVDTAALLREAGLLDVIASWMESRESSAEVRAGAIQWLQTLGPDEAWLRAHVLPILEDPGAHDADVMAPACLLLGTPGNAWAYEPLLAAFTRTPRKTDWSFISMALTQLGDPRAIPTMIAMISTDNTYDSVYGIGYFGLAKWTGVGYDETHDGPWWLTWWDKNRDRLPEAVRGMSLPRLVPVAR